MAPSRRALLVFTDETRLEIEVAFVPPPYISRGPHLFEFAYDEEPPDCIVYREIPHACC